jgi:hypothetical protein
MQTARVQDFAFILTGLLTQYDQKESLREMKRGGRSNIYRLGHLLEAAQKAEDDAKVAGIWERDDREALERYLEILRKRFIYQYGKWALSPLAQLEKRVRAWLDEGKLPKYGTVKRDNPQPWAKVFG